MFLFIAAVIILSSIYCCKAHATLASVLDGFFYLVIDLPPCVHISYP